MSRWLAVIATAGVLSLAGTAEATSIIRNAGQHDGSVEVEVHGNVGFWWSYGFGPGVRIGIPIMRNGFVSSINNDVRINFGADLMFWPGYCYGGFCRGDLVMSLIAPVMLQWNFFLTDRWSIFAEAGFAPNIILYNDYYVCGGRQCGFQERFNFWPGTAFGARFHFRPGDFPTLTMRIGFPTGFNIGVSF